MLGGVSQSVSGDTLRLASFLKPPQQGGNSLHTEAAQPLLNVAQLVTAADYAALCGQCYMPEEQQSQYLAKQGLTLVARGRSAFTRHVSQLKEGCQKLAGVPVLLACMHMLSDAQVHCRWYVADRELPGSQAGRYKERMILMRGVSWRGGGPDSFRIWRELTRVWPQPFEAASVSPEGCLLAHTGTPKPGGAPALKTAKFRPV